MRLKDKVAIITGSSRGLGQTFARRFAKEGAKVVVCDILDCEETADQLRALGAEVLSLKTDVTSEAGTAEMAQKTIETFGRIDILVNNAAIFGGIEKKDFVKPIEEINGDEWDRIMAVNVKGVFLCSKAVIPQMKTQGGGKIVNIASTTALMGLQYFIHYTTSKGAVIAMTKGLARGLGDFNINVNAVAPGLTWTGAALSMFGEDFAQGEVNKNQLIKKRISSEDIANVVVFLASDEAAMVTGALYAVNAGEFLH